MRKETDRQEKGRAQEPKTKLQFLLYDEFHKFIIGKNYNDSPNFGAGGSSTTTSMAYETYEDFPDDIGLSDTTGLVVFSESITFDGNYYLTWANTFDLNSTFGFSGSLGGFLSITTVAKTRKLA